MALQDLIEITEPIDDGFLHCHHYYAAISHYRKKEDGTWERSFVQHYFDTPATSHEHQWQNGHDRVDALRNLTPGVYLEEMHHPEKSHPHLLAHKHVHVGWAEYHPYTPPPTTMGMDAITGDPLSQESVYIPHAGDANPTNHYQELMQRANPGASLEDVTFACNTFDNAIELAHRIIDEILHPHHLAHHGQEVPS